MATSSTISRSGFKSPFRCLVPSLLQSRERWKETAGCLSTTVSDLKRQLHLARQCQEELAAELAEKEKQIASLRSELERTSVLFRPTRIPGHQFSAETISLCCLLSLAVGLRAVPKVLKCLAESFDLPLEVPSREVVRTWNCRNGIAILQEAPHADDWIWMVDHSVQLGNMFVLVVLGIRESQLPDGRPLQRKDMTPLAVMPTKLRNKEEVGRQLHEVAQRCGMPKAILSDGASELHEGAQSLKSAGFSGVHLCDTKHLVSNLLKKQLGSDERFREFTALLGKTGALIQQTELDHLTPPRNKEKCRFMNFDRIIDWATMAEHQLRFPTNLSESASKKLVEKLGWLHEFHEDLNGWRESRNMVGQILQFANEQGVFIGSTATLRNQLEECDAGSKLAQQLREKMISLYQSNEDKLAAMEQPSFRLPCSTEILESAFGSFKVLQANHARGTFTSLLAVFPTLFDICSPEKIRRRLALVSNSGLEQWLVSTGLKNSTHSRRSRAYEMALAGPGP